MKQSKQPLNFKIMKTVLFLLSVTTLFGCVSLHFGGESSRFAKNNNPKTITVARLDSAFESDRIERMKMKMM
jgi:hypothetical protein